MQGSQKISEMWALPQTLLRHSVIQPCVTACADNVPVNRMPIRLPRNVIVDVRLIAG